MMKLIREGKLSKVFASYLAIQLLVQIFQPTAMWALTGGPSQPEFNSFTPIGTSDMVDLASGDFNYNIPIMDVGGYPLNLAYQSGITMDQEASWVGLGWNLNVGQISRNVRGLPDDFKGDEVRYENDLRQNITIGSVFGIGASIFGKDSGLGANVGLGVEYNNYTGLAFRPSFGVSFAITDNLKVGLSVSSSTGEGATVTPNVSLSKRLSSAKAVVSTDISLGVGLGLNSRKGAENLNLSASASKDVKFLKLNLEKGGIGGSISLNDQNDVTPTKRVGMHSNSVTFAASAGGTVFGVQLQGQITGYGTYQDVKDKDKSTPAYGYEYTDLAEQSTGLFGTAPENILDFTREKERTVSDLTQMLPVTNYTYDLYSIQGQGVSGMFRPHRSQIGYVYDPLVSDSGSATMLGAEFGAGNLFYAGLELKQTTSTSSSKLWSTRNNTLANLKENNESNTLDYEKVYHKNIGEGTVDRDIALYSSLKEEEPIAFEVNGGTYSKSLDATYHATKQKSNDSFSVNDPIQRGNRYLRNQNIEMITQEQALTDVLVEARDTDDFVKAHHNVGAKILKPDGSTYVFGESAYNVEKVEATFDVSGRSADCSTGLVSYNGSIRGNGDGSASNEYLNRITTPAYAHTYLLSSVLSSDYEDLLDDGPTDDDLGSYTKFEYLTTSGGSHDYYKWRVPYQFNMANYNEGLKTNTADQTANYLYGEKELKYVQKIETKTHVAVFDLSSRDDAQGVRSEQGGESLFTSDRMQKIDRIYLLSKPEYEALTADDTIDFFDNAITEKQRQKASVKIAHFDYNYSLCQGVPNNLEGEGKLTLEKLYFTYRDSYMGKYTPYEFEYKNTFTDSEGTIKDLNYNLKGYDIWANFKENAADSNCSVNSALSPQEFPFVEQDKDLANSYAGAWSMEAINLPSGGRIELDVESDDYGHVQDKKAMRMFKVSGSGNTANPSPNDFSDELYDNQYLYVKLNEAILDGEDLANIESNFEKDYFDNDFGVPMYFRFLLNMTSKSEHYDYVEGYLEPQSYTIFTIDDTADNSGTYAAIELDRVSSEGSLFEANAFLTNPISKSGWHFARTYLNKIVYNDGDVKINDLGAALKELLNSLGTIEELIKGPNGVLKKKGCAKKFIAEKSWIRLHEPTKSKLGGGMRVKSLKMYDNWDVMTSQSAQFYGQEYAYTNTEGTSSGVATFEPNSSNENPLVQPFYDNAGDSYADRISSPSENNYVKLPMGEAFYPSAQVTYGRVQVKNLAREDAAGRLVKKHATGAVITEFFTTKDFPTISKFTDINSNGFDPASNFSSLLKFNVKNHMVFSQGFSVVTNDMNAKQKSQWVYPEGSDKPISGVTYEYNQKEGSSTELDNSMLTINEDGEISKQLVGQNFDVVNDFRQTQSNVTVGGVNANLTGFLAVFFPALVPVPLPTLATHENILRLATTTKVVHKTGILTKKTAYDLGASVSTENIAWDANTGEVLLTKTENEFDEYYYNLNYPAYWAYAGMGMASQNIGIEGSLTQGGDNTFSLDDGLGSEIFTPGDVLEVVYDGDSYGIEDTTDTKLWVLSVNGDNVTLMNREGVLANDCELEDKALGMDFRIVRSGNRNVQQTTMQSITTKINPVANTDGTYRTNVLSFKNLEPEDAQIVNASAVEYSDFWQPINENGIGYFATDDSFYQSNSATANEGTNFVDNNTLLESFDTYNINPYVNNIRGDWRAKKSWAYLTGRHQDATSVNVKNDGYFTSFAPFYEYDTDAWSVNLEDLNDMYYETKWTFASEVTKYSPYGVELENRDALGRYSSAQYGYNYTLPVAVASNTAYSEIGFDGFEDYEDRNPTENTAHFSFSDADGGPEHISNQEAHTGRRSISVNHGTHYTLTKSLIDKSDEEVLDCPIPLAAENIVVNTDDCIFSVTFDLVGEPNTSGTLVSNTGDSLSYNLDENGTDSLSYTSEGFTEEESQAFCSNPNADEETIILVETIHILDDSTNDTLVAVSNVFRCGDCYEAPIPIYNVPISFSFSSGVTSSGCFNFDSFPNNVSSVQVNMDIEFNSGVSSYGLLDGPNISACSTSSFPLTRYLGTDDPQIPNQILVTSPISVTYNNEIPMEGNTWRLFTSRSPNSNITFVIYEDATLTFSDGTEQAVRLNYNIDPGSLNGAFHTFSDNGNVTLDYF